MAVMPVQKPGRSKQNYQTPVEFIEAVMDRLGITSFGYDLAAEEGNQQCLWFLDEDTDALSVNWDDLLLPGEWAWLNPPFAQIAPWAKKCAESDINIAFLVPAAVGANWFRDYVDGTARVLLLNGRLSFDGKAPYPKDCVLCLYGPMIEPGYEVWSWQK